MDIKSKKESGLLKVVLSCDSFTIGYIVLCLFFFVPYVVLGGGDLVLWFLPLALIIPFALMPLIYMLIHRFDLLLFGRYHLAMPISAFVAALFFVMAWTDGGSFALVFFGALFFVPGMLIYRYCAFSVRARLLGEGIVSTDKRSVCFTLLGAVAAIATLFGFYSYDPFTTFLNTSYVMSAACVILAVVHYLTTYYGIPRLGGKRLHSFKTVVGMFYGGLDKRMYFSSLLFEAAFACIAAFVVIFCFCRGMYVYTALGVDAAIAACFGAAAVFGCVYIKRRSKSLSVINAVCFVLSAALLIVCAAVELDIELFTAFAFVAAGLCGVGGAVSVRQTKLRLLNIKPRITAGTMYMLWELTGAAAAAIALIVAALVITVLKATTLTAFVYGFAAAAVFAVVAFALAGKQSVHSGESPKLTYELSTAELDRATASDNNDAAPDASDSGDAG